MEREYCMNCSKQTSDSIMRKILSKEVYFKTKNVNVNHFCVYCLLDVLFSKV